MLVLGLVAALLTAQEPITNEDVQQLVAAGLDASTIVRKIETTPTAFRLETDALIALKEANVPEAVIQAMLRASATPTHTTHAKVLPGQTNGPSCANDPTGQRCFDAGMAHWEDAGEDAQVEGLRRYARQELLAACDEFSRSCNAGHLEGCMWAALCVAVRDSDYAGPKARLRDLCGVHRHAPACLGLVELEQWAGADLKPLLPFLEERCHAGMSSVCGALAVLLLNGDETIPVDLTRAQRTAEGHCPASAHACAALAYFYATGQVVPKDRHRAAQYARIACDELNECAIFHRICATKVFGSFAACR